MDQNDYEALRQKNISEREAFFAEFLKGDLKETTDEIKKIQKEQWNESDSENQQPKKRRRMITKDSEFSKNFQSRNIQFRRTYNTRSRKNISYIDEFNDSDDEDEENKSLRDNRSTLKVLFPWAKPFQRCIDLMKIVCDVDEENENSEEYSDYYFNDNSQKRKLFRHRVRKPEYDPDNVPSVDEITDSMLKNVAKRSSKKTYCKIRGTSCHQCRQKTLDTKTVCRSGECIGVRGQFCGPCLRGRYGENAVEALKDPNWACPPCRGLCNCSICRNKDGLRPTGCLVPKAQSEGYASVKDYLQAEELGTLDTVLQKYYSVQHNCCLHH